MSENHGIGADVFDDSVDENVHCAFACGIAGSDAFLDDAAVIGNARKTKESGLFIDEVVESR